MVHRTRRLDIKDVSRLGPLWPTSDARTLIDLADVESYDRLRAIADELPFLPVDAIQAAQARVPGRHGATLRDGAALGRLHPPPRGVGADGPQCEWCTAIRVDCWYQRCRSCSSSTRAHHMRQQEFKRDRLRDRALERHDIPTLRFRWHDLDIDDARAAQDVR